VQKRLVIVEKGEIVSYVVLEGTFWGSGDDERLKEEMDVSVDGEFIVTWRRAGDGTDRLIRLKVERIM